MRYITPILLAAIAVAGCDKATEPSVATTLSANSSVTVAATVGGPVSPAPSVIVKDQHGSPMAGVPVTFAVTAGGGTATGVSTTTSADGTATVGSWVLGTSTGSNTLTASSGTLASVTFTASATAGPPAAATKATGDNISSVVGSAVATPPSVLVKDAYGNPTPGVNVTFTVTAGGGKITDSVRTTGSDGTATLGSWTLGNAAITNTVRATAGSLPPLTFAVNATAGPAARIIAIYGNGQTARVNTTLPEPIAVRVTDAFDNAKSGLNVTFAVTQGGGSLVGTSTISTDFQGIAVNVWRLGPTAGVNLVTATLAGVGTVTFSATAVVPDCSDATYAVGTTVAGELTAADCVLSDLFATDYYRVVLSATSSLEIREASTEIDPYLIFTDASGFIVAEDDDDTASVNSRMHVLAPAGTFKIGASSFDGELGHYTMSSSVVAESEERCDLAFIVPGITTRQSIASTDCVNNTNNALHADVFIVRVRAGQLLTVHMSSSAVNPAIEFYGPSGLIATTYGLSTTTATDAEIRVSPASTGYYYIVAVTPSGNQFGAYDLSVTASGASSTASSLRGEASGTRPRKGRINVPWHKSAIR